MAFSKLFYKLSCVTSRDIKPSAFDKMIIISLLRQEIYDALKLCGTIYSFLFAGFSTLMYVHKNKMIASLAAVSGHNADKTAVRNEKHPPFLSFQTRQHVK